MWLQHTPRSEPAGAWRCGLADAANPKSKRAYRLNRRCVLCLLRRRHETRQRWRIPSPTAFVSYYQQRCAVQLCKRTPRRRWGPEVWCGRAPRSWLGRRAWLSSASSLPPNDPVFQGRGVDAHRDHDFRRCWSDSRRASRRRWASRVARWTTWPTLQAAAAARESSVGTYRPVRASAGLPRRVSVFQDDPRAAGGPIPAGYRGRVKAARILTL